MKIKIGAQMMMLKQSIQQIGVFNTIEKVKKLGYDIFEVSMLELNKENLEELLRAKKELGIEIASLSANFEDALNNFETHLANLKLLEVSYLRMGSVPKDYLSKFEDILEISKQMDGLAQQYSNHGVKLYLHNHHWEFRKFGEDTILDIIKMNTKYLGFEIDTHWVHRGGMNVCDVLEKFANRIDIIHLKDYRIGEIGEKENKIDIVEFGEIGTGNLQFDKIIDVAIRSGAKYAFVEQDATYNNSVFKALEISRTNLNKLGY